MMKSFEIRKGNFIKSNNSTKKMMNNLIIALLPIIIFAIYKNGIYPVMKNEASVLYIFKPMLLIGIPIVVCLVTEYVWYKFIAKLDVDVNYLFNDSFAIIPGLFLGLMLPINTPILILILGSVVACVLGKLIFGRFGNSLLNPALVGKLFVMFAYLVLISNNFGYLNAYEQSVEALGKMSPITSLNYIGTYNELVLSIGSLWDYFIGMVPGALGETSVLLCLVGFIYLIVKKALKWRISLVYIGTVLVVTFVFAIVKGIGMWYPLFHLLSGGLMFGAVFVATDMITSPITNFGQIVYGVLLGIVTSFLRIVIGIPEAVLVTILAMNLLVPIINKESVKMYNDRYRKLAVIVILVVISFLSIIGCCCI